jgi:hypothetical protein
MNYPRHHGNEIFFGQTFPMQGDLLQKPMHSGFSACRCSVSLLRIGCTCVPWRLQCLKWW